MLTVGIARTIEDDEGGAYDFLVVVEEKGDSAGHVWGVRRG